MMDPAALFDTSIFIAAAFLFKVESDVAPYCCDAKGSAFGGVKLMSLSLG